MNDADTMNTSHMWPSRDVRAIKGRLDVLSAEFHARHRAEEQTARRLARRGIKGGESELMRRLGVNPVRTAEDGAREANLNGNHVTHGGG